MDNSLKNFGYLLILLLLYLQIVASQRRGQSASYPFRFRDSSPDQPLNRGSPPGQPRNSFQQSAFPSNGREPVGLPPRRGEPPANIPPRRGEQNIDVSPNRGESPPEQPPRRGVPPPEQPPRRGVPPAEYVEPRWGDDRVIISENKPWDGKSYSFGYKSKFGDERKERGYLRRNKDGRQYLDVEGEYIYPLKDGTMYRVVYRSDDRGFTPRKAQRPPQLKTSEDRIVFPDDIPTRKPVTSKPKSTAPGSNAILDVDKTTKAPSFIFPTEGVIGLTTVTTEAPTTSDIEATTFEYDEYGNRVGLPPEVVSSLLGG